ncbi:hypothetical protein COU60_03990 [Candidatus Pacearchaeota archaeon CG10_big_fil_rev_8_21_14_0_10_34_76]|nr:MAG: hypothetical protein COU60_03990 [Candidatus Pacearchaeota archaeon CG10_big_fil_rev_8_21_14_0_10_34_76]
MREKMHRVNKPIKERSPSEIESELKDKGEFVQMSYLQRALDSGLDFETKKYVLIRLSKIYENKGMYSEAAKCIRNAADINTTFRGQITDYMKAVELYVRADMHHEADRIFSQALALGNGKEKMQMKTALKDYYLTNARRYMNSDKRNYAKRVFEKTLTLDLEPGERREVQQTLLDLYQKLGNIKEYYQLKQKISGS